MMNKINYQNNRLFENTQLRRLSICTFSLNDSELQGETSIKQLLGGSIDYSYYDKEARVMRSGVFHGYLTVLVKIVRRIWS